MSKIKFKEIVLGTHYWSNCPHEPVSFLRNEHHHDFHITVSADVSHNDRDMEWIMLRIDLKKFMKSFYNIEHEIYRFAGKSCEMIAKDITTFFKDKYGDKNWKVSVSEDDVYEGGDW